MTEEEKAEIMLEEMDTVMQIDWNLKEFYIKAIKKGLRAIDKQEKKTKKKPNVLQHKRQRQIGG